MTTKEKAISVIRSLDDNATLDEVIDRLHELREVSVETLSGVEENVKFKLPPELKDVPKVETRSPVWSDA